MDSITIPKIRKMSPQLLVADIDRSIEFYINKLGFDLDFFYDGFYAGVIKDGHSIHLKSGTPSAEERNHKRENEDLDIVFSVKDVEPLYNELQLKAVEIARPLCDRPYGKEFYIVDPDGYLIAFLEEA
jgi:catechol 2,3-dioxygenase-like lactoylglutathione lyase family enzyme